MIYALLFLFGCRVGRCVGRRVGRRVSIFIGCAGFFIRSDDTEVVDPFCQNYRGTYCAFLSTEQIYVTSRVDQSNAEAKVIRMYCMTVLL